MTEKNISKLVDGYKRAFIDSSVDAEPSVTPVFVSNANGNKVLTEIEHELRECDSFCMSVAFVTKGGVTPLLGVLKELEHKHIPGKILTTDYLMFSDPKAIDSLSMLNNIEVKLFRADDIGFHTKGYIFHGSNYLKIIVGSSNLTQNAITRNHEWNTKIVTTATGQYAKDIENEFNQIWEASISYEECREDYSRCFNDYQAAKQALGRSMASYNLTYSELIRPNAMQSGFSSEIQRLILAGQHRALLISATGTGKTYASAFAVRNLLSKALLRNRKILFLSHREQINVQALNSFRRVLGNNTTVSLLSGTHQDIVQIRKSDILFSTMNMMAKEGFREKMFSPEEFSFIILDECHRVGAESYQKIINYFHPQFLLGMSASPDRSDGFDVYEQFDHNIACEIRLQTALENDLLCPFHYFGISDLYVDDAQTDFRKFKWLTSDERVRHVLDAAEYYGYSGTRVKGLVFCSSKEEAAVLSEKFNGTLKNAKSGGNGYYHTQALTGNDPIDARTSAIERLVSDRIPDNEKLDYIFTIDIFNEGVDIPEINQVIMLRPTKSAIIFVQQLGRGLRKADGKEYVVVLDFIANYDNNYLIPIALSGDRTGNKDNIRRYMIEGNNVIQGASTIYFDAISRQRIFKSLDNVSLKTRDIIIAGYNALKHKLGRRPRIFEFDKYQEIDPLRLLSYMDSVKGQYRNYASYYGFQVVFDNLRDELSPQGSKADFLGK